MLCCVLTMFSFNNRFRAFGFGLLGLSVSGVVVLLYPTFCLGVFLGLVFFVFVLLLMEC